MNPGPKLIDQGALVNRALLARAHVAKNELLVFFDDHGVAGAASVSLLHLTLVTASREVEVR